MGVVGSGAVFWTEAAVGSLGGGNAIEINYFGVEITIMLVGTMALIHG